jgi:hypothetical protein
MQQHQQPVAEEEPILETKFQCSNSSSCSSLTWVTPCSSKPPLLLQRQDEEVAEEEEEEEEEDDADDADDD